jgi:hypothetical protein
MGRDTATLERRAVERCLAHGRAEPEGDAIVTQGGTPAAGEDSILRGDAVGFTPPSQRSGGVGPQRALAFLAAFQVQDELHLMQKPKQNASLLSRTRFIRGVVSALR